MMKTKYVLFHLALAVLLMPERTLFSQTYVAGHLAAKEGVLRSIPQQYIDQARRNLVVAYQHTSHGTHVSRGVFGLPDYKTGDAALFAVSGEDEADKLEFRDYALESYAPAGVSGADLSQNETAFIQTTRNYLDAPENASVNVVMWSWCNIAWHDVEGNYLPGMDSLVSEYGPGGSKIGTGEGQREEAVTFIYMTGHANLGSNTGELQPKAQAALIIAESEQKQRYCLDYYSIDTHDMDDNYWEDAGDNGNSDAYGGNFYIDWQNAHSLGEDYYENKESPGGYVAFGAHNTQHITANRKAYAFWWILARIAGWDGDTATVKAVEELEIQPSDPISEVRSGDTVQFSVSVLPVDASDPSVEWTIVPGSGSARIDQEGLLIALLPGSIQVKAASLDGSGVIALYPIDILAPPVPLSRIDLSAEGGQTELITGTSLQIFAQMSPENASNKQVVWSLNPGTGTGQISDSGLLQAGDPGTVTVVAAAQDGSGIQGELILTIREQEVLVNAISIQSENNLSQVDEGASLQFSATVSPQDATDPTYSWSVINGSGSATIDQDGLLTAHDHGEVTVRATANDASGIFDEFSLTILEVTSQKDSEADAILLYPNPGTGQFIIETRMNDFRRLQIMDPKGTIIRDQEIKSADPILRLDLRGWEAGLYFILLRSDTQVLTSPVVLLK